jgi:predicted RNA-binding protein
MKKAIYNKETGEVTYVELTQEEEQEIIKQNEIIEKENEIKDLKEKLNATDYKIIKASEYNLLGLECEYNIQELHTARQELRDRINELEGSN